MKRKKVILIVLAILSCIGVAIAGIVLYVKPFAFQVSIIGGNDGPTSIFMATKLGRGPILIVCIVVIALILAGASYFFIKRKK